jgi:hypothetical protein
MGRERRAEFLIALYGPIPLVAGAPLAGEMADRRIKRTGDDPGARFRRGSDRLAEMRPRFASHSDVIADQAESGSEY